MGGGVVEFVSIHTAFQGFVNFLWQSWKGSRGNQGFKELEPRF